MYTDLLPRFKNAALVRKKGFQAPYSNMDFAITKILEKQGFLKEVKKRKSKGRLCIEACICYKDDEPILRNFSLKSKPGRHLYRKAEDLYPVKQGYGTAVVSTSEGVLTAKEAKKRNLGGEYLFEIW